MGEGKKARQKSALNVGYNYLSSLPRGVGVTGPLPLPLPTPLRACSDKLETPWASGESPAALSSSPAEVPAPSDESDDAETFRSPIPSGLALLLGAWPEQVPEPKEALSFARAPLAERSLRSLLSPPLQKDTSRV